MVEKKEEYEINGQNTLKLVKDFGSPLYAYDESVIKRTTSELLEGLKMFKM